MGLKHYDDVGILKVAKSFYEDLYNSKTSDDDVIDQYFELLDKERSFNDIDSSICEGLITKEECTLAVNKMKQPKSRCVYGETLKLALKWTLPSDIQIHKGQLIKAEIYYFT